MEQNSSANETKRSNRPRLERDHLVRLNKERLGPYLIRLVVILPLMAALHYLLYTSIQTPDVLLQAIPGLPAGLIHVISPAIALVTLFAMGFIMSGLMVLAHEMSHGHLITFTPVNLLVGTIMAIPLAVPYPMYGLAHKLHHTYNTTKRDPSYYNPSSSMIRGLGSLLHYLQLTFFLSFFSVLEQIFVTDLKGIKPGPYRIFLAVFLYSSIAALIYILGFNLWIWHLFLPWLAFQFWNTTRAIGEHEYMYDGEDGHRRQAETTRSFKMGFLTRFFWWYAGYHIEHHLYPSIPFHNLPEVADLMNLDQKARMTYVDYMKYRWKRGAEFPMFF